MSMPTIDTDMVHTPDLDAWSDGATILDAGQLELQSFARQGPYVVYAFHGTPHAFERFDPKRVNNIEAQFGAMIYATSDPYDAWHNYALETGPDLCQRIDCLSERLACDMREEPESYGLHEDDDEATIADAAVQAARQQLLGHAPNPRVLGCALRFSNPFIVNGYDRWVMPGFVPYDAIETDVPYPDEDDEDGEEAYYEALDAAHMAQQQRLIDAFHTAEGLLDLPYGTLPVPSALLGDDFDATSTDLEKAIHDEFGCLEHPDHGGFIGNAIVSAVVQALGFDAIILLDANTRFRSMDMHPNTAHLHVFEHRDDNLRVLTVCAADRQETALAA